jgi:hypothetical protein
MYHFSSFLGAGSATGDGDASCGAAGAGAAPMLFWQNRATYRGTQLIQRAAHRAAAVVQHMRVDHRRLDAGVTQQFLHGAYVIPGFDKCVAKEWRNT